MSTQCAATKAGEVCEGCCDGCGRALHPADYGYTVCMPCTIARAKAVGACGRCVCKPKDRRPLPIARVGSRSWKPCGRCLGTIRQLS